MSWNATVDRLRARAQHEALASDEYTRRLLFEAVDEITRQAERVPNPDDLRNLLAKVDWMLDFEDDPEAVEMAARVRATLEGTE